MSSNRSVDLRLLGWIEHGHSANELGLGSTPGAEVEVSEHGCCESCEIQYFVPRGLDEVLTRESVDAIYNTGAQGQLNSRCVRSTHLPSHFRVQVEESCANGHSTTGVLTASIGNLHEGGERLGAIIARVHAATDTQLVQGHRKCRAPGDTSCEASVGTLRTSGFLIHQCGTPVLGAPGHSSADESRDNTYNGGSQLILHPDRRADTVESSEDSNEELVLDARGLSIHDDERDGSSPPSPQEARRQSGSGHRATRPPRRASRRRAESSAATPQDSGSRFQEPYSEDDIPRNARRTQRSEASRPSGGGTTSRGTSRRDTRPTQPGAYIEDVEFLSSRPAHRSYHAREQRDSGWQHPPSVFGEEFASRPRARIVRGRCTNPDCFSQDCRLAGRMNRRSSNSQSDSGIGAYSPSRSSTSAQWSSAEPSYGDSTEYGHPASFTPSGSPLNSRRASPFMARSMPSTAHIPNMPPNHSEMGMPPPTWGYPVRGASTASMSSTVPPMSPPVPQPMPQMGAPFYPAHQPPIGRGYPPVSPGHPAQGYGPPQPYGSYGSYAPPHYPTPGYGSPPPNAPHGFHRSDTF